jgi:hypothetical protein
MELRAKLPPDIEIWAGGANPVLHRRPPPNVRTLRLVSEIGPAMKLWRSRQGEA